MNHLGVFASAVMKSTLALLLVGSDGLCQTQHGMQVRDQSRDIFEVPVTAPRRSLGPWTEVGIKQALRTTADESTTRGVLLGAGIGALTGGTTGLIIGIQSGESNAAAVGGLAFGGMGAATGAGAAAIVKGFFAAESQPTGRRRALAVLAGALAGAAIGAALGGALGPTLEITNGSGPGVAIMLPVGTVTGAVTSIIVTKK